MFSSKSWLRQLKAALRPNRTPIVLGNARARLLVEALEDRVVPAYFHVWENPQAILTGDARGPAILPTTGPVGSLATYAISMTAGQGPVYPEVPTGTRWEYSRGGFSLGGAFTVEVLPDSGSGEQFGDLVLIDVDIAYTVTGGNGAGVGGGHTDVGYDISLQVSGPAGTPVSGVSQGTLFSDHRSAKDINLSPTSDLSDFAENKKTSRTFEARVGDTVSIPTSMFGRAATWQGGLTGMARGAVTGSVHYSVTVTRYQPELSIGVTTNTSNQTVDVAYEFSTPNGQAAFRDATLDLYWGDAAGCRLATTPFYTEKLPVSTTISGTRSLPLSLFSLSSRPANATQVLFVAADPDDSNKSFREENGANNYARVALFKPTIVELVANPNKLIEKEGYTVSIRITNPSLVDLDYKVKLEREINGFPNGLKDDGFQDGYYGGTIHVPALSSTERALMQAEHDWDWIPDQNPVTLDALTGAVTDELADAVKEFGLEFFSGLASSIYSWIDTYQDIVGPILEAMEDNTPDPSLNVNYIARLEPIGISDPTGVNLAPTDIQGFVVNVAALRQGQYATYLDQITFGKIAVALGTGKMLESLDPPNPIAAALGLSAVASGFVNFLNAKLLYDLAKDPPDPRYQEIATPDPIPLSAFAGYPDDLAKFMAQTSAHLLSLRNAQATSRNRADGAREAGDSFWEATQASTSSEYAAQATIEAVKFGVMNQLLRPFYLGDQFGIPDSAEEILAAQGLPQEIKSVMADLGFSRIEAEQFQNGLIASGFNRVDPALLKFSAVVDLTNSAITAMEELEAAVEIRAAHLGATVTPVTAPQLDALATARLKLDSRLSDPLASAAILHDITAHINQIRDAIRRTNNFDAYADELDRAYLLLLRFAATDWSIAGLKARVATAEGSGGLTPAVAAGVRGALGRVETAISTGRYADAAAELQSAAQMVTNGWSAGTASTALALTQALSLQASLLTTGTLPEVVVARTDAVRVVAGQPSRWDVLANDTNPTGGPLRLLSVATPQHGTAAVDDAGTPSDVTDDRVTYTPGPSFRGTDVFVYYVSSDGIVGVATGEVTVRESLVVGQEYNRTVQVDVSQTFVLDAQAGGRYQLETLNASGGSMFVTVTDPIGNPVGSGYVRIWDVVAFRTFSAGQYRVEVTRYTFGPDDSREGHVTFRLVEVPTVVLTLGQEYTRTIPRNASQGFVLSAEAGVRYQLETLNTWGEYAHVSVMSPTGNLVGDGTAAPGPPISFKALSAGQYQIELTGGDFDDSPVTFRVVEVPTESLILGQEYTRTIPRYQTRRFTLDAQAGSWYRLETLASLGYANVTVTNPDGIQVAAVYALPGVLSLFQLLNSGQYEVVLSNGSSSGTTEVTFRLVQLVSLPTVTRGEPVTGTLNPPPDGAWRSVVMYRLPVIAGERVALSLPASSASALTAQLYGPDGGMLTYVDRNSREGLVTPTASDEYLVVVSASYLSEALDYEFTVRTPVTEQRTMAIGDTAAGILNEYGDRHIYTFAGTAGRKVLFDSSTSGYSSLKIRRPDGQQINASGLTTLPADGQYEIVIQSEGGALDYRFRILDTASQPLIAIGEVVSGTFEKATEWANYPDIRLYRLALTEGQALALDLSGSPPSADGQGSWNLFGPNDTNVGGGGLRESLLFTAPTTGEYYLQFRPYSETPFSFRFIPQPEPISLGLTFGETVEGAIDIPGRVVRFNFTGAAGQPLYYESLDRDFDRIVMRLRGPDGRIVQFANADLDDLIVLPAAGDYQLEIDAQGADVGDFKFRLSELADPPLLYVGQPVSGAIDPPGSSTVYAFDGVADQRVLFENLSVPGSSGANWLLYGPDGRLLSLYNNGLGTDFAVTLPTTGRYFLAVDGWSANAVTYDFQVTEPPTTTLPLAFGATTAGELLEAGERHTYTFSGGAGQVLYYDSLDADQEATILKLLGPGNVVVASFGGSADGPAFLLPETGEYRLSVLNTNALPGDYAFRLIDVSGQPPVQLGQPVAGLVEWVTGAVSGSAGGVFRLSVPGSTQRILDFASFANPYPYLSWSLYDPTTTTKLRSGSSISSNATLTLPRAGDYVLVFEGAPGESVEFQFQVNKRANTPPVIYGITDQTATAGGTTPDIFLDLYDNETSSDLLTVSVSSSDGTLTPEAGIIIWDYTWYRTLTITPAAGRSGVAVITVTVTDGEGETASTSFTLTVNGQEPANQPPALNSIGNKAVDEGTVLAFTAVATDADAGQSLRYSLIDAPTGATIEPFTGMFSWVPTEGQGPGTFTVTLRVTDNGTPAHFDEETIVVTVNEANQTPVLAAIGDRSVVAGQTVTFTATATDPDLPANALTFSLVGAPAGATIDATTGTFSWTPGASTPAGDYTFTVRVTDNGLTPLSAERTVTVTVVTSNNAPTDVNLPNATVAENRPVGAGVGTLSVADPDAGDTFTFALVAGTGGSDNALFAIDGDVLRTAAPFDFETRSTYDIRVQATDAGGLSFEKALKVFVTDVNEAPVLDPVGGQAVEEGSALAFTASATDPDLPAQTLTYSLDQGAPDGATIDPTTGIFSWTPPDGAGDFAITVRVNDSGSPSQSVAKTVMVHVSNVAPTVSLSGPASGVRGQTLTYAASVTDPGTADTHALTWTVTRDGAAFASGSGRTFSFVPIDSGTYRVTLTATDDDGGVGSASLSVVVTAAALQADPLRPGHSVLVVGGTTGVDDIGVSAGASPGSLVVTIGGTVVGTFAAPADDSFGRIVVYAQAGNDDVQVAGNIGVSAWLYGGGGHDRLKGGAGDDVLVGGDGDDLLVGGSGRDLMIGGRGADRLVGNAGDDLLIAGYTAYDTPALISQLKLFQVRDVWTSGLIYTDRVSALQTSLLRGEDGDQAKVTVFDDGAADVLTGSAGQDWFLFQTDGDEKDKVTDLSSAEFADDRDFIDGVYVG